MAPIKRQNTDHIILDGLSFVTGAPDMTALSVDPRRPTLAHRCRGRRAHNQSRADRQSQTAGKWIPPLRPTPRALGEHHATLERHVRVDSIAPRDLGNRNARRSPSHDGDSTDDQRPANVALYKLRGSAQPVLATARMLARREAIQAAKSHPLEKVSIGGAMVVIAVALTAPTPGIVVSRLAVSSVITPGPDSGFSWMSVWGHSKSQDHLTGATPLPQELIRSAQEGALYLH